MLASSKDRVRKQKEARIIIFVMGILGLTLLILSFWVDTGKRVDTGKIGAVLCAGALIGHLATWKSKTNVQPRDQNRKS